MPSNRIFISMLAGLACLASGEAARADPVRLDAVDMIVDWKSLFGQRAIVTGCLMVQASETWVSCRAANDVGTIYISSPSLDRESLRRALKECSGLDENERCRGEATGIVYDEAGSAGLRTGIIRWDLP